MKQFSQYLLAGIACFATIAHASNCNPGLTYCGSSLISKGNYQGQIDQALFCAGVVEVDSGHSSLFFCEGGDEGVISYVGQCAVGKCVDGGSGVSDHC
ncbi:hypothetical protein B0H11DRAFT_2237182 [Mycena galericulata]|nr:hypothetical protein B0H11DRAFT_2237182 [Mycena galericulata]